MPSASKVLYFLFHAQELIPIIKWKLLRKPLYSRDPNTESPNLRRCYDFLYLTSRSFVAVVQELHPELLVPVCIFYLVLRGLDTIEDDMTLPINSKEPLLRDFHAHLSDESWTFDGSGPNEKDRQLLVEFSCVAIEFNNIKPEYRAIIKDITKRMGNGMADFAKRADDLVTATGDSTANGVDTIKDYELYCHYVAGLVGEGLTRLFIAADFVDPTLLQRPNLMESMAQLLQQTNIIRDVREDFDSHRYFWPREVWSRYVSQFSDLFLPRNRDKALQCSSEMILLALKRCDECLLYMASVTEQSTFNFVAIPQSMAIATLELCFRNSAMFERNIKITKGEACQAMLESTEDVRVVHDVFRRFAGRIREKNVWSDPHFEDVNVACGRIERVIEKISPAPMKGKVSAGDVKGNTMYWALGTFAILLAVVIAVIVRAT